MNAKGPNQEGCDGMKAWTVISISCSRFSRNRNHRRSVGLVSPSEDDKMNPSNSSSYQTRL